MLTAVRENVVTDEWVKYRDPENGHVWRWRQSTGEAEWYVCSLLRYRRLSTISSDDARDESVGADWVFYQDPDTGKVWKHCESTGEAMWAD